MFSKFFCGQNESTLAALEVQWRMEYTRAQRKFQAKKVAEQKRGHAQLGHLNLNVLNDGKSVDLSELARKVATTRAGQRAHKSVAKSIDQNNENKDPEVIL